LFAFGGKGKRKTRRETEVKDHLIKVLIFSSIIISIATSIVIVIVSICIAGVLKSRHHAS
jgi:multisubunit Na+/H+ antiporter MnhC subunit